MNTPSEPAGQRENLPQIETAEFRKNIGALKPPFVVTLYGKPRFLVLAPPSSLDGERAAHLERGIAEIMAGLVSGKISGEDIVWASEIETLWDRCHAILDPEHSCELPQTDDADEILAALAAAPLPVGEQGVSSSRDHDLGAGSALKWRPLEYERPKGKTFDEMRTEVWKGELYKRGDTILVWVNEGDLYLSKVMVPGGVKLPPSDPTGSHDSQDAEPAGPTFGAKTPSPPLTNGEPETP